MPVSILLLFLTFYFLEIVPSTRFSSKPVSKDTFVNF
jgi:hypothetical protein